MPEKIFKNQPLYVEEYNDNGEQILADLSSSHDGVKEIADNISNWFNQSASEKTRIKNRINKATGDIAALRFALTNDTTNATVITEEFTSYENVDIALSGENIACVSTAEGVLTLAKSGVTEIKGVTSAEVHGTGFPGNGVVVKYNSKKAPYYIALNGAYNDPKAMYDGKSDTWMEYSAVRITDADKAKIKYDYSWSTIKKDGEFLQLVIKITLDKVYPLNFISISPYIPEKSDSVIVTSINVSENGVDYFPIDPDNQLLNKKINYTNAVINQETIAIVGNNRDKFTSQGAFYFDLQYAKYIEIIMTQPKSYEELLGHTCYMTVKTENGKTVKTRQPASKISSTVTDPKKPRGTYKYKQKGTVKGKSVEYEVTVEKGMDVLTGWRYCIGVRDIALFRHNYKSIGQIITKDLKAQKPIKKVAILSEEIINKRLSEVVGQAYDNIRYYISIDNITWTEILPLHKQAAFSDLPKFIEINRTRNDNIDASSTQIVTNRDIYSVRLKIVMASSLPDVSPILENYTIKFMH